MTASTDMSALAVLLVRLIIFPAAFVWGWRFLVAHLDSGDIPERFRAE